jgi:acetoin utilization deacetylase AcuC-like enzyme
MKIFYSAKQELHNPPYEGINQGKCIPSQENHNRIKRALFLLQNEPWAEILTPQDFGLIPILEVHSDQYRDYLQNAYEVWQPLSPAPGMAFIPYTYGINHQTAQSMSGIEQGGFFLLDTTVGISGGTYIAAIESAYCALSGAQAISLGEPVAVGLCRPPGHHAGAEICGGYCFLNNAAIAAQWLSHKGKVAILDIDYHAGNGTQDIFYDRPDVFMVSIHADPAREYPYYAGFASETGTGKGAGCHHNFPLPTGTDDSLYLDTLNQALALISDYSPDYLVVSVGMDIYKDEPIGDFSVTQNGIRQIGQRISALTNPTLIVLEGGYYLPLFGENFCSFVQTFI